MELDPGALAQADRYKILIGAIVPRPIALVSTLDRDGRPNLAPFSFFMGVSAEPLVLAFAPANRPDGGPKDTLRNLLPGAEGGTGEFVVNASVGADAREVSAAGEPLPFGESEFALVGLTPAPSRVVRAPRVLEAPWSFECRTRQVLRLAPGIPGGGNLVLGDVVHVWLADGLADERLRIDPDKLRAIGRLGGETYARTRDRFDLPRGRASLDVPAP